MNNEILSGFLVASEGVNNYSDFEVINNYMTVFKDKKIASIGLVEINNKLSSIYTNLSALNKEKSFDLYLSRLIEIVLFNLSEMKEDQEKIQNSEEFDFLTNVINNILSNNEKLLLEETVGKIIISLSNYNIKDLYKKSKNVKNIFDLFYKILQICQNFNISIINLNFDIDYNTILKTFLTKFEKKELNLNENELILSNLISSLNTLELFKTDYLNQLISLLIYVQDNEKNQDFFSLNLQILAVINNLLYEFTKRKNMQKYGNLNVNFEKENIIRIKNFIFRLIDELIKKSEQVEDSETTFSNYLNLLNSSFEIIVKFSLNQEKAENICLEILNETFKKIDQIHLNILSNKENLHVSEKFLSDINYNLIKSVNSFIFLLLSSQQHKNNDEITQKFISELVKYSLLYFYNNTIIKDIFNCIVTTIKGSSAKYDLYISCFIANVIYYNYLYNKSKIFDSYEIIYNNIQMDIVTALLDEQESKCKVNIISILVSSIKNHDKKSSLFFIPKANLPLKFFVFNFLEKVISKIVQKDLYSISKKEGELNKQKAVVNNEGAFNSIIDICFNLHQHIKQTKHDITSEDKELFLYYKQLLSFEEILFDVLKETNLIYYILPYLSKFDFKAVNLMSVNYILKKFFDVIFSETKDVINKINFTNSIKSGIEILKIIHTNIDVKENSTAVTIIPQTIFSILTKIIKNEDFILLRDNFSIFSNFYTNNNNVVRAACFVFVSKIFNVFDEKFLGELNNFIKEFILNLTVDTNVTPEITDTYLDCLIILTDKVGDYFSPFVDDLLKNLILLAKEGNLNKINIILKKLSEKVIFDVNFKAISNNLSSVFKSLVQVKVLFTYFKNTLEKSDKLIIESLLVDITKLFLKSLQLNLNIQNVALILDCFSVFVRKMNPRQLEKSLEQIIKFSFKIEKESAIGFSLSNSVIGYQLFNKILESAAQLFVVHLKRYVKFSNEILNSIYSIYTQSSALIVDKKKMSREFFDDKSDYHQAQSYLTLNSLILENFKLNFKFDKDIILNDEIEEIIQPICNQVQLKYLKNLVKIVHY